MRWHSSLDIPDLDKKRGSGLGDAVIEAVASHDFKDYRDAERGKIGLRKVRAGEY